MADQKPITKGEYLSLVQTNINSLIAKNAEALPNDFNKQRFVLNCMAMMKDKLDDYKGVKPETIGNTFLKGAFLGLDFFNGECYAIPYKGVVTFQTDYKGEIKLAKKYSRSHPIKNIYAKNVREGDFFEVSIEEGEQKLSFRPKPFNNNDIIGSFAVIYFEDGSMLYEEMSVDEILKIKNDFSKASNSPAWNKTPGEMYKKTVLRRLLKMVDLSFDNANQDAAFQDGGDFDNIKAATPVRETVPTEDVFSNSNDVIDVEPNEIVDMDIEEE